MEKREITPVLRGNTRIGYETYSMPNDNVLAISRPRSVTQGRRGDFYAHKGTRSRRVETVSLTKDSDEPKRQANIDQTRFHQKHQSVRPAERQNYVTEFPEE
jgi:hypothetical protein